MGLWLVDRHVMLTNNRGVVTSVAQQLRKPGQVSGYRLMEFGSFPIVMWVATGNDT